MISSPPKASVFGMLAMLVVAGSLIQSFGQERLDSASETNPSVEELIHKRHEVLSQLVKVQWADYRKGETSIETVVNAHQDLVGVELELATTDAERIALLEKAFHLARDLENVATAKYQAGQASQADVLKSQAARLNAEILLLRERHKTRKN